MRGAVEKGIIYGTGVYHAGEIKDTKCMQVRMMGKKLSEMTLEELWQLFPIYLTP